MPFSMNAHIGCLPDEVYNEFIVINPQERDNKAIYSKKINAVGLLDKNNETILNICFDGAYNVDKVINFK